MSDFIITTFYTPNYAKYFPAWEKHVSQWGYPYTAREIPSRGKWNLNDCMKPRFILDMLNEYPDKAVLWTDIDSLMVKKPVLLETIDADMAGVPLVPFKDVKAFIDRSYGYKKLWRDMLIIGGTLWFANNDIARTIVNLWVESCDNDPHRFVGDQDNLNEVLDKYAGEMGLRFYDMPFTYGFLKPHEPRVEYDGHNKMGEAVIIHDFASRDTRRHDKGLKDSWETRLGVK